MVCGDLPAELRADGAAARNQDDLAVNEVEDFLQVGGDGLTAQKILDRNALHLADGDVAGYQLVHAGEALELAAGLLADGEDVPPLFGGGAGEGEVDLLHAVLLSVLQDGVPAADDRDTVKGAAPFVGVIVNDADDLLFGLLRLADIPEDHLAGIARADEHDMGGVAAFPFGLAQEEDKAVEKADTDREDELDHRAEDIIGNRHAAEDHGDENGMKRAGYNGGENRAVKFGKTGEAPEAVIHAEGDENSHADEGIDRDKVEPGYQIVFGDAAESAVEAEPQREEIGEVDGDHVIGDEKRHDDLPVLYSFALQRRLILTIIVDVKRPPFGLLIA